MSKRFNSKRKAHLRNLLRQVLSTEKFWSYRVLKGKLKQTFNEDWGVGHIASVIFDMDNIEWKYVYAPSGARVYAQDLRMWIPKGAYVFRLTIKISTMSQNHGKYKLSFVHTGANKLNVVREVKNILGCDLMTAKNTVDACGTIAYAETSEALESKKNQLESVGALCVIELTYANEVAEVK